MKGLLRLTSFKEDEGSKDVWLDMETLEEEVKSRQNQRECQVIRDLLTDI